MKDGIFISHIGEEKLLASRMKELLSEAFGTGMKTFVSSDYDSIRSGSDWHGDIIAALKSSRIVLILCSPDSVTRPWINYEAGVGDGTDWDVNDIGRTFVIPVTVRNLSKGKLQQPLSRKHARDAHDPEDVKALLRNVAEFTTLSASETDVEKFVKEMQELSQRIQMGNDRLSLSDADYETYIKNLITSQNENEFLVHVEDLRERAVDCWGGDWPNSIEAINDRFRDVRNRSLLALYKLTLLGVLLIKYSRRLWLDHIGRVIEQVFRISAKLANLTAFAQIQMETSKSQSLDEFVSHKVPALEALLSAFVIGAFAIAKDNELIDLQSFFPRVVPVVSGPREFNDAYKKPILFWPIEYGIGYPDVFRYNLALQRYGSANRISALFGGIGAMKSALLQLDCYIEWNSFLCVQPPVIPEIEKYLQEFFKGVTFSNHPHFIFENTRSITPMIQFLWGQASSGSLNHLTGFALDTNIAQRLVNMGPGKRRELFADFVLYAQQQRAIYCRQRSSFPELFSWPEDLSEAINAAEQRREARQNS